MPFSSETEKIYDVVKEYLHGVIYDIGCGNHKVTPDAIGIDGRPLGDLIFDGLIKFPEKMDSTGDVVFSSHVLEHMEDDCEALMGWTKLLKIGGYLILYLPDGRHYDHHSNPEHMRHYTYEDFMFFFKRVFCGQGKNFKGEHLLKIYDLVMDGTDFGKDRYSFFLVAKRVA